MTPPARTRPIGSAVGAIAGLVFVLVNAGAVPGSTAWRVAAVLASIAVIWFVVVRGPRLDQQPPTRAALRTYGLSVTAMVIAIPIGAAFLTNVLDRPDVVVVWVVFLVGAHFLPFARAFDLPLFRWLSVALVLVALVGAVATLPMDDAVAAGWTGVIAGGVLLAFSAIGPRLTR